VTELARDFVAPLDELSNAVTRAEQELKVLRTRQLDQTAEMWNRYKPEYERYLRPQPLTEDEDEFVLSEDSAQTEQMPAGDEQTDPESEPASESASDERPTEPDEPKVPEVTEAIGEAPLEGSEEASS
jgi:hypothetical protein